MYIIFAVPSIMRGLLLLLMVGFCAAAGAQRVTSLSQVKTVFVDAFNGGAEAAHLRDSLVRRLSRSSRFHLVQSAKGADAIVSGTGQIWVRGYITINPRTPSSDRQAVYSGYLSLEVAGADGQPLWSWLVTPGKFSWNNIIDNLASHAAQKLIEAGESTPTTTTPAAPAGVLAQTGITGAGATFPAPLYKKWFEDFERLHPGVHIGYSPVGSQLGIENLVAGKLDFAGADVAPEVVAEAASASKLLRFASVLGAVVPIYNLKGVTRDLRFTSETLAGIYLGKVRRWNDPEIRGSNKGVNLPDEEIAVFHRSDGSGTTWAWSDFLSKVSPAWASSVGRGTAPAWPVGTGSEHNEGVAESVQNTPNSIGYVELAYAIQHQLSFASVRNRAGEFIRADLDSLAEAAREAGVTEEPPPSITDPSGKNAYPISAFTWIVIPAHTEDAAKRAALVELLHWVLTDGQKECAGLGYVALPRETVENQLRRLNGLP
jgi:phosphate transport system substrate-binding protein